MELVAIYVRLSDEDRDKACEFDESESIQNQKNLLIKYATEKGWGIYKIYCDEDYSGLDKDRPEFNQMLKDAEQGKFNIILCKHQSRFSRDIETVEKYLHNKFVEWGIRFVSVVDGVDTLDRHNKKSRQVNALINEWYCEDISESIRAVFRLKQNQGKFIGSFACYGYRKDEKDKNKLVIDEEAAAVVRQIFEWYLQGFGTQKIANLLNERGIPNPTKYKILKGLKYKNYFVKDNLGLWNKTTVKRILKNRMYVGDMVQHKYEKISYKSNKVKNLKSSDWVIVENTHEAIIDKTTFYNVQERLKKGVKSTGEGRAHIFAGKVICKDCKSTMVKVKNGAGNTYLRCKLYAISGKNKLCTSHSIRFDRLERIVEERLKEHFKLLNEEILLERLKKENGLNRRIKVLEREIAKIHQDILDREKAIKNIYLDKVKGLLDETQFMVFNDSFLKEKNELIERKKFLEIQVESIKNEEDRIQLLTERIKKYIGFKSLTHELINELIDYIEIGEKDEQTKEQEIIIHWLF